MKTFLALLIIAGTNALLYFFRDFIGLTYHIVAINAAILFIIIIYASSGYVMQRSLSAYKKELAKTRFKLEDEEKEIQILHALNEISENFVHEKNLGTIFEQTLLVIRTIIKVDIAVLFLCDSKTKEITKQVYMGIEKFEVDNPILERTLQKGASILINRLSISNTEYKNCKRLYEQGFKSLMIAPITMKDKNIGLLGIFSKNEVDFDGSDLRVLTTFSTHVSIIIENGQLMETTQQLAITDEMTQLYNYRYFRNKLQEEFSRAQRYVHPLTLVMLDVDYFKHYNDSHGHPMGDYVLKGISALLKHSIRPTDFAARYGGEEFVIILVETDKKGGELFAEKLRKTIADTPFKHEEQQPNKKLTVSVGLSNFPVDSPTTPQELIDMADKALYQSKNTGRNRVSSYGS